MFALALLLVACNDQKLGTFNGEPGASIVSPADGASVAEGAEVELRGAASDADDASATLLATWYVDDVVVCAAAAPADDGTTTCPIVAVEGMSSVRLEVRDPQDAVASDTISLTVVPTGTPTVDIEEPAANTTFRAGEDVYVRGVGLDAEDAPSALVYAWASSLDGDLGLADVPGADGVSEGFVQLSAGDHVLTLSVTDTDGKIGSDSVPVRVQVPNEGPACAFTAPATGERFRDGETIVLEGEVTDPDGPEDALTVRFESDQDGVLGAPTPASDGGVALSTVLSVGTHVVTLHAADPDGATCSDAITLRVGGVPEVEILVPTSGDTVALGAAVELAGVVSDPDDPPEDLVVEWESSLDGVVWADSPDSRGETSVTLDTLAAGTHTITLTVTDTDGLTATDSVLLVVDAPPSAPVVAITPAAPTSADALTVTISTASVDPEGAAVSYRYEWLVGGVVSGASTSSTLPSSATVAGEAWTIRVYPDDGFQEGLAGEDTVTIGNGAPSIASVTVSPDPATVADSLTCSWSGWSDPDGDADASTAAWTIDGVAAGSGTTLSSGYARGDVVACTVTPYDGASAGSARSDSVTIGNATPSIRAVTISPDPASASDALTCAWSGWSDADGDADASTVAWTIDGVAAGSSTTLSSGYGAGDVVRCTVTPYDGRSTGTAVSDSVTIENGAPSITSVTISPDPATAADALTCSWSGWSDPDGDADASTVAWTIDGVAAGSGTRLTSGYTRGDLVVCTVTPFDGTDTGVARSDSLTVSNSTPSITSVAISPDPATVEDTLTCAWSGWSDADGDTDASTVEWTVDGAVAGSGTRLSSGFGKGDLVRCTVTPDDGYATGTARSDSLTIDNAPPSISALSLTPSSPTTSSTLTASVSGSDPDGDSVSYSYAWYVNGSFATSGSASLSGATWFDKGDRVYVVVTPSDGTDTGASATSSTVTVGNTAPGAPTVSIVPAAPTAGVDDLVCQVDTASTDADGDSVSYTMSWTVDGVAWTGSTFTSTWPGDGIDAADTAGGDVWRCTVTPSDGTASGTTASASVTVGAGSIDYSGTWTLDSTVSYTCVFGIVNFSFRSVTVTDANPTIIVNAGGYVGSMSGSFTSATDFDTVRTLAGTCTETYEFDGTFVDEYTMNGSFTATYTPSRAGACYDCSNRSWSFTATR